MVLMRIGPAHRHLNYRVQFAESGVAPDLDPAPDWQFGILQRHFVLLVRGGDFRRRGVSRSLLTRGLPRRSFICFCRFSRRHIFVLLNPRRVSGALNLVLTHGAIVEISVASATIEFSRR